MQVVYSWGRACPRTKQSRRRGDPAGDPIRSNSGTTEQGDTAIEIGDMQSQE
jgi:hypothetical protein